MHSWWSFFFSSRRRHTRCALVTGVQTCALPISCHKDLRAHLEGLSARFGPIIRAADGKTLNANALSSAMNRAVAAIDNMPHRTLHGLRYASEIGRASCRERVCQYVENEVVDVSFKKKK